MESLRAQAATFGMPTRRISRRFDPHIPRRLAGADIMPAKRPPDASDQLIEAMAARLR